MNHLNNLFYKNLKYFFFIIIIIFFTYIDLFFGGNFFNYYELDIHVMFDYLARSNLNGWRLDKIIGTNMLIGDSSFHAWSILSLIYNLSFEDKILLHNLIFILFSLYAAFSLFYFLNFINPNLNKIYVAILSCLIFVSILRLEFNYVFSWLLVYPTVILTSIVLFKFYKSNKNKYIFQLFLIYFVGFNLGSVFAIQQSLFFSILFSIFYMLYFKEKIYFKYIKIISISLVILFFSSSWILYPYFVEKFINPEIFTRTADYKSFSLIEIDLELFKLFYNTLFGTLVNLGDINFPDRNITPTYHWNNTLPIIFNLIFLYYLFIDKTKNFWIFLSKNLILFYLIHILLSEVSPFYYSINLFILDTMSWSKTNIELYIFQIVLLSFFITKFENILKSPLIKIYFWILFLYLTCVIIFSLDIVLGDHFTKGFVIIILKVLTISKNINFTDINALNLFIEDLYQRFEYILNYKFFLTHLTSLLLFIILYLNNRIKNKKYLSIIFTILIFLSNFFATNYFTPIEKNNFDLWKNVQNENIIKNDERIIVLTENFLFSHKNQKINTKNLSSKKIKQWIKRNPIEEKKKYYGIMSPPYLSFSSNASFINTNLVKNSMNLFNNVPDRIKEGFTSANSFEILQEGIYNKNYTNNLSIKYAYSAFNLSEIEKANLNLKSIWNDKTLFLYEIIDNLDYFYIPKKILTTNKKLYEYKINNDEVFLSKTDFIKFKDLKTGPAFFNVKIKNNSVFEVNYNSEYENILVISNFFDGKWEHNSNKNLELIKVNDFFTGIVLRPGKYEFDLFFNNSSYFTGIIISIVVILILSFFYLKNIFNFRK